MSATLEQQVDRYGQPLTGAPYTPAQIMLADVTGDGRIFTGLGGMEIAYKTVRAVCIGKRTSGKTGSGSYDDPWAANSQSQFDAIMADVTKAAQTNTIIKVRDGEFLHTGQNAWYLRAGSKLIGEGPGVTILKLDPSVITPSYGINGIHSDSGVDGNGIHVEGLTIDLNYQNIVAPHATAKSSDGFASTNGCHGLPG